MSLGLSRPLDAGAERRLVDGWRDGEVTITTLAQRFRLSPRDVELLKAALGAKAKLGPSSCWTITAAMKRAK